MKNQIPSKRTKKSERESKVLLGLVELYLQTGKPIGSSTLQEEGFGTLSSATIRNYFATLEEQGYLTQPHTSGGRVPTDLAFKAYAEEYVNEEKVDKKTQEKFKALLSIETKEPAAYLNQAAEILSQTAGLAVFISAPRFDHDFIIDVKLVGVDTKRVLVVLVTSFGLIQTEVLYTDKKLAAGSLKRIEAYFLARLCGKPTDSAPLEKDEESIATTFYHEVIIRYIVGHANFTRSDITHTGFSHLLDFPEFNDPKALAGSLSLFENRESLAHLLNETKDLRFFIGDDLLNFAPNASATAVISIPYYVNQSIVGAVGVLGPTRIPYKKLFAEMRLFSALISESLTKSLYKFKLKYRQPATGSAFLEQEDRFLLEDQRG